MLHLVHAPFDLAHVVAVVGEGALGDPRLRKRRWMQLPPDEANTIREEHSVQDTEGGE